MSRPRLVCAPRAARRAGCADPRALRPRRRRICPLRQQELLAVAERSVAKLEQLVASVAGSGWFEVDKPAVVPSERSPCVRRWSCCSAACGRRPRRMGPSLVNDVPESLPALFVDEARLRLALSAALDNAVRFASPAGTVRVSAHERDPAARSPAGGDRHRARARPGAARGRVRLRRPRRQQPAALGRPRPRVCTWRGNSPANGAVRSRPTAEAGSGLRSASPCRSLAAGIPPAAENEVPAVAPPAQAGEGSSTGMKRILVVDDDRDFVLTSRLLLRGGAATRS